MSWIQSDIFLPQNFMEELQLFKTYLIFINFWSKTLNQLVKATQQKQYFYMQQEKTWSDTVKLGDIELRSRVVMTSLTRIRCDPKDGIPTELVKEYYTQRAGAALILTEASSWSQRGHGFPGAGNLYTKQQAEGWRKVVESVHAKGAKIFIQLCHCGRATNTQINGGLQVWAPSAIQIRQKMPSGHDYGVPKEMTIQDIKETQEEFRKSVKLAKEVGFDGIELHGANGYLIDQFLRSESNKRTDQYGGSAEKRVRYVLELVDIALETFKPYQIGIKISPTSQYQDMYDLNPVETYTHLLKELSKKNIGFVEGVESTVYGKDKKGSGSKTFYEKTPLEQIQNVAKAIRSSFNGLYIANESMTAERGLEYLNNGWADLISFGRLYISNPDLAERLINNQQLNTSLDFYTLFSNFNPKGYTDYPFYDQWIKQQQQAKV